MKVPDGSIDRRARGSRGTRDEGDPPSPQLFGIEGDDEVSLPLIEVGEQRGVFLLQSFFSAHTGSISGGSPIITIMAHVGQLVGPPVQEDCKVPKRQPRRT